MTSYSVTEGTLRKQGKKVDQIPSSFVGGGFAKTPKIAVMHFTFGASARSSAEWFRNPAANASAHIVIDRDGTVIQCVPLQKVAWHAGKSKWHGLVNLNSFSIGIELANWGYLRKGSGGWLSHAGTAVADAVLAVHRNGNPDGSRQPIGWEPYPPAQIAAAVGVVRALVEAYGIDEIIGHDDIAPTRKWDPGPAFDMTRFRNAVFGGRASEEGPQLKVAVASGLNLRSGAGTQFPAIELLAAGTLVEPMATDGAWMEVSVLDGAGDPRITGWVHGRFLTEP